MRKRIAASASLAIKKNFLKMLKFPSFGLDHKIIALTRENVEGRRWSF